MSRGLKLLARELETPVMALSQLNRGLELRQDKRPMLADLRESGSIENDADTVTFLYREEMYDDDPNAKGKAEAIVAKNRHGQTNKAHLQWDAPLRVLKDVGGHQGLDAIPAGRGFSPSTWRLIVPNTTWRRCCQQWPVITARSSAIPAPRWTTSCCCRRWPRPGSS